MDKSLEIKISYTKLLKFTLPTIISNVFMSIYSTIDGIFVSNFVGTNALSAVNIVMPLLMISIAVGTMFGTGGSALISKTIGEGKHRQAKENFSLLILTTIILASIVSIVSLIFRKPILYMLGANDVIYKFCEAYAIPILIIIPFCVLGILFNMFFIVEGKPKVGMISSLSGGIINLILDYILIAKLNLGLSGAAIATGIGYSFPTLIGLIFFFSNRKGILYITKPKFKLQVITKTVSNGVSEMVTMLSLSIATIAMNNIVIRIAGVDGVSATTIISYTQSILASIYIGYSTGVSPIISFNFGKEDIENLKKIYKISLRTIALVSVLIFASSFILSKPIIGIFAKDNADVFDLAYRGFSVFSFAFLFMGINIFASAMFTALNNGIISAVLSFLRTLGLLLVSLLVFPNLFGVIGVWIATPVSEFLSVLIAFYCFNKFKSVYKY